MDKILTVYDVADILQVKPITVREMFRQQRLRGFKVGKAWRIAEKTLQEDIESIASGETPQPKKPPRQKSRPQPEAAPAEAQPAPAPSPEPTPSPEPAPPPEPEPSAPVLDPEPAPAPPVEEAAPPEKKKPAVDDTQQLLF